jgi:hypothetical protein
MSKSNGRVVAPAAKPARVKTAVVLSAESAKKLGAASVQEGMTQSELVEYMIGKLLSGYVISVRGPGLRSGPGQSMGSASPEADVKLDGAEAA